MRGRQALRAGGTRVVFVYGGENRGAYSSEALLRDAGEPIRWVDGGKHSMHADAGHPAFWALVARFAVPAGPGR